MLPFSSPSSLSCSLYFLTPSRAVARRLHQLQHVDEHVDDVEVEDQGALHILVGGELDVPAARRDQERPAAAGPTSTASERRAGHDHLQVEQQVEREEHGADGGQGQHRGARAQKVPDEDRHQKGPRRQQQRAGVARKVEARKGREPQRADGDGGGHGRGGDDALGRVHRGGRRHHVAKGQGEEGERREVVRVAPPGRLAARELSGFFFFFLVFFFRI